MNTNDSPPPPLPKRPDPPQRQRGSLLAVAAAGLFALVLFIGMVMLAGVLGPIVLAAGGLLLLIPVVVAIHYVLWGYWLSDSIHREVEEDERRKNLRE